MESLNRLWEHVCGHCRAKIWLHYQPILFKRAVSRYAVLVFLIAAIVTVIGIQPLFQLDRAQAVIFSIILLGLFMPAVLAYAKYQSAVLKEEK